MAKNKYEGNCDCGWSITNPSLAVVKQAIKKHKHTMEITEWQSDTPGVWDGRKVNA